MSAAANFGRRIGNELYKVAFPIYRPLYSVFKSYTDRAERSLLAGHLSPGAVVVDAGANVGIYSQFLSQHVGSAGMVHSFEPEPKNFARLRAAIASLPNVRANQLALSDWTGESMLYVSDDLNVDHRAYPTEGETRRSVPIRSSTLDDYFKPGDRVDLIKMDVQGYELHALRGAKRVLADNHRIKLLVEFWPYGLRNAGSLPEVLFAFLRDQKFTIFALEGNDLRECNQSVADHNDATSYINLFAQR